MRTPPARILITGANGFIGRALIESLGARWPATALTLLVRDRARAERAGLAAHRLVQATLAANADLRAAAKGVEAVVHLAGAVRGSPEILRQTNVEGTKNLLSALPESARVLLVSSLAAATPSTDGKGTAAAPDGCRPCSVYGETKRLGEIALLEDAARTRRRWLALRPCLVYGPGDGATSLLFRQAGAVVSPVPWRPRPLSTLHVRDVCAAILAALARADASEAFVPLGGEVTDSHALLRSIGAACGQRPRLVRVPDLVAAAAGHIADVVARVRGAPSYFSRDKVREIAAPGFVADPEPARRLLGFAAAIGLQAGLADVARGGGRVGAAR